MNPKFLNIINSSKPVLVDFYADWCMPCKEIPQVLKKVKKELNGGVKIVKVNVDKNPIIATNYKVRNLPTIIVFKEGNPQYTVEGVCEAEELKRILEKQF
jgi:thioredoxin 1